MSSFGDNLRRQRELRGISLEAISNTTKISTRMLRAIEDEHFDQLPGGVFNKGFVRAYARQVGLEEEEAVADYLVALRESQIHSQSILPDFRQPPLPVSHGLNPPDLATVPGAIPAIGQLRPNGPLTHSNTNGRSSQIAEARTAEDEAKENPSRLHPQIEDGGIEEFQVQEFPLEDRRVTERRIDDRRAGARRTQDRNPRDSADPVTIFPSGLGDDSHHTGWIKLAVPLLLIAVALAFWNHYRGRPAGTLQSTSVQSTSVQSTNVPSTNAPSANAASTNAQVPMATAAPEIPAVVEPPVAAHTRPPAHPAASRPMAATSAASRVETPLNPELHRPEKDLTSSTARRTSPSKFTLVIRASQNSWISITADGQPIARETLIAPANTSVRATHDVVVKTGNSAGISFLLNGKEIPNDGSPGEARTYTFDASGLRASAEPQPAPAQ